jgi:hypothetical protein
MLLNKGKKSFWNFAKMPTSLCAGRRDSSDRDLIPLSLGIEGLRVAELISLAQTASSTIGKLSPRLPLKS